MQAPTIVPVGSIVLLIGPPAAGKSTLAAELVAAGEVDADSVLSADAYRDAITGDANDTRRDRQVWSRLRRDLVDLAAAGRTAVVDATNLFPRRRARHIRVAREHGRPVVAVVFEVELPELLARNEARDRVVRPGAVVTMAAESRAVDPDVLVDEGVHLVIDAASLRSLLRGSSPEDGAGPR